MEFYKVRSAFVGYRGLCRANEILSETQVPPQFRKFPYVVKVKKVEVEPEPVPEPEPIFEPAEVQPLVEEETFEPVVEEEPPEETPETDEFTNEPLEE